MDEGEELVGDQGVDAHDDDEGHIERVELDDSEYVEGDD